MPLVSTNQRQKHVQRNLSKMNQIANTTSASKSLYNGDVSIIYNVNIVCCELALTLTIFSNLRWAHGWPLSHHCIFYIYIFIHHYSIHMNIRALGCFASGSISVGLCKRFSTSSGQSRYSYNRGGNNRHGFLVSQCVLYRIPWADIRRMSGQIPSP